MGTARSYCIRWWSTRTKNIVTCQDVIEWHFVSHSNGCWSSVLRMQSTQGPWPHRMMTMPSCSPVSVMHRSTGHRSAPEHLTRRMSPATSLNTHHVSDAVLKLCLHFLRESAQSDHCAGSDGNIHSNTARTCQALFFEKCMYSHIYYSQQLYKVNITIDVFG